MDRQNVSKRDGPLLYAKRLSRYFAVACAATFQVAALGLMTSTAMRRRWKPHITVLSVN
jgi:hypothetical protein